MKKTILMAVILMISFAANAQNTTPCGFKYGATEQDSISCLEQITLFRTSFDQKNYDKAYGPWQEIVHNCPCSWNGVFANASKMLEALIKAEKDSVHKDVLIDTLIWVYNNYATYHPKSYTKGKGIGWAAYYTMKYRPQNSETVFNDLVTSIEMEKQNTQPAIWDLYFQLATMKAANDGDTATVVEAYERATEYIDEAIISATEKYEADLPQFEVWEQKFQNNEISKMQYDKEVKKIADDTTRQIKLIQNYKKTAAKVEKGFIPYANGNVLLGLYANKFEENKNNIPALKKMLLTLDKDSLCRASKMYRDILEIVHNNEPNGKSAYMMAMLYFVDKDYSKATEYLNQAISLFTTNEEKANPYYLLAVIDFTNSRYSAARTNCYSALRCNPNMGRAYILIGDMYRASYNQYVNGGEGVIAGAVYWAAADKYNKAQSVDPSVANECAKKRATLGHVSDDVLFNNGLKKGTTYHIGGWIGEDTIIR